MLDDAQLCYALNFIPIMQREDFAQFKKGGITVTLYRSNSPEMLQPHDTRFGSIKRCTLKNFTVFLEAVIRMTPHSGLVSIFAETRK